MKRKAFFLFALLFLVACGGNGNEKKEPAKSGKREEVQTNGELKEIASSKISFGKSVLLEKSNVVVIREENGKGLFVYDLQNQNLKQISEQSVREFKAFDNSSVVFYTKKDIANPPKYELRKYSNKDEVTTKILIADKRIRYLQKIGNRFLLYWLGKKAFLYDLRLSRIVPVEKYGSELFYYGVRKGDVLIYDFGKRRTYKFSPSRIIWTDANFEKKTAVVYVAPQGTFLLTGKGKSFIGKLENPGISPDGFYICGVKEIYANQEIVGSDVYIYNFKNKKLFNFTHSKNVKELLPSWSSKGNFISYSLPNGVVKFLKFKK